MTVKKDTANISEALLSCEIDDYKALAEKMGLTGNEFDTFVRRSVVSYVKAKCESVLMPDEEAEVEIERALLFTNGKIQRG